MKDNSIYRWIPASERLPEEIGWYCLKNINPDGFHWYDGITFVYNNKPMEGFHDGVVWLCKVEEDNQDELWTRVFHVTETEILKGEPRRKLIDQLKSKYLIIKKA